MPMPRYVVAKRFVVPWLLQSDLQERARRAAEHARLAGRTDLAEDLEDFAAQLREAKAAARGAPPTSANGSAEVAETEIAPHSDCHSSLGPLTAQAAADLLGVSARWVRELIEAGTLGGSKVAGRWMVDRESVEQELLARSKHGDTG